MSGTSSFAHSDQTTPAQVAAAVLSVLRELTISTQPVSSGFHTPVGLAAPARQLNHQASSSLSSSMSSAAVEKRADASVHLFPGSLVLERHVYDMPMGTRELAISPKTVVTPLAREILKKKGVSLRWVGAGGMVGMSQKAAGQWAVLRMSADAQAQAVESLLVGRTGEGWDVAGPALNDAASWTIENSERHLAVLAEVACVAVWRLNQAGIRAAEVRSALDVERVVQHFAPQSLVVEPSKLPIHEVKQIFQTWRRMGVVAVPPELAGQSIGQEATR